MSRKTTGGHVWENYFMSERRKRILMVESETRMFFWRTTQRQEVDLVEVSAYGLKAYEVKWNPLKATGSFCKTFVEAYPHAECTWVSPINYMSQLM